MTSKFSAQKFWEKNPNFEMCIPRHTTRKTQVYGSKLKTHVLLFAVCACSPN